MTATVTELLAAGSRTDPAAVCRQRVWMQPGVPVTIGHRTVAEIQLSIVGDRCLPRLVVKGRPRRRTIFPWRGRTVETLERGQWTHLDGHDLMVCPLASQNSEFGRPVWMLVEFAAMTPSAAKGWPL